MSLDLRELWEHRELLYFLVWRDIKVRYKQTFFGATWAILQPVLTMLAFSLFFGRLGRIPSDGIPYPVFAYAGLLPWGFFAHALGQSSNSLVGSANLIKKVYFPRLVIPLASVLSGFVDLLIGCVVLVALILAFGIVPKATVFLGFVFLVLAMVAAFGIGLWTSALNVRYRDVRHAIPFIIQIWLFVTPVAYPSSLLSEPWRTLYGLNPMVGVVEGFRWAIFGTQPPGPMIALSAMVSIVALITGAYFFRRMEQSFADVV